VASQICDIKTRLADQAVDANQCGKCGIGALLKIKIIFETFIEEERHASK
jgi:hypothetical protein